MEDETDAPEGAADATEFSIEDAVAAYAKSQEAPEAADTGQADEDEPDEVDGEAEDDQTDVEGDTADDDQAEDEENTEDGDAPESDGGRFVADNAKVRLDDGTVITVSDLKQGSLRNADYTRKTQELAEQRRSYEGQSERNKQLEQQLSEKIEKVDAFLKHYEPQPPDPAMLDPNSPNYDPVSYLQAQGQYEQINRWVALVQQERQQAKEASQAATAKERAALQERESAALVEKMPELRDQKRAQAFAADIQQHLPEYGFQPDEIRSLPTDHRQYLILRDAIKWRKLQTAKAEQVRQKGEARPPVQKGGKRLTPNAQKARTASAAQERLKQTGSLDDAVAAYLAQKG